MRLSLDTEFNGFGGELISIGLVAEDGREFYEVVGVPEKPHPWVKENVLPQLGKIAIGYGGVRRKLHGFLAGMPAQITVAADWPEDHAHFMRLLLMAEEGEMCPIAVCSILARPKVHVPSEKPHNALEDARALGRGFGFIQ